MGKGVQDSGLYLKETLLKAEEKAIQIQRKDRKHSETRWAK